MQEKIFVRPAQGYIVLDPVTMQELPPAGDWVPASIYWRRRLDSGDVLQCSPPKPKSRKEA